MLASLGYEEFLTSLLTNEAKNLPRGIHHASARKQPATSNQSKALETIPEFLRTQYEKNKQPALRQGLAGKFLSHLFGKVVYDRFR